MTIYFAYSIGQLNIAEREEREAGEYEEEERPIGNNEEDDDGHIESVWEIIIIIIYYLS